jgi:hypothetical protein
MIATNYHAAATNASAPPTFHDIKPPVEIPNGWVWAGWIAALLVLAALAWWLWRRWQKKRSQPRLAPLIPAHVRAARKLREALVFLDQPREFCIRVSDITRAYLEERFDFRAPERTTEEFLHELQATNLLLPDQKTSLGDFLNRCDLVKFARYEPGEPELRDLHAAALRLVEETTPVEEAPKQQA